MQVTRVLLCGAILLLGVAAWAQEFPKAEIGVNYSYADYHASTPYSHSHSLNGGGGELNFNFNEFVSIKMDLQGYGSNVTTFNIAPNSTFPLGASGNAKGDLFTYLFGPQYKIRAHRLQPYGHFLIGGAHTNVYGNAFKTICPLIVGGCTFSRSSTAEAFALDVGVGVDIPFARHFAIRPFEFDYLLTRFSNPFTGVNNQNNFRYSAGIVFALGHTHY
jgi:hypothetical protein